MTRFKDVELSAIASRCVVTTLISNSYGDYERGKILLGLYDEMSSIPGLVPKDND